MAIDFKYDGTYLSSKGYVVCSFNNVNNQISNGGEITFTEVPLQNGIKRAIAGYTYNSVITTSFSIMKNPCNDDDGFLTTADIRDMARWLERTGHHAFILEDGYHDDIIYYGSFHIDQILNGNKIIGLQLTFTSNSPFGWGEEILSEYQLQPHSIYRIIVTDESDRIGSQYIKLELTLKEAGDLTITNSMQDKPITIKNCSVDEKITISYPKIETNLSSHNIANDFNYIYPILGNTNNNRNNTFLFSLCCDIALTYQPIIQMGV